MSVIPGVTQPPPAWFRWQTLIFRQQFAMAAGDNYIVLPGYQREPSLNPASVDAIRPSTRGGIRWLALSVQSNAALAAGDNVFLYVAWNDAAHHTLAFCIGTTAWPANIPIPLVRGATWDAGTANRSGMTVPCSVWVPDPMVAVIGILSQAGTETVTVSGTFCETNDRDNVPPDLYAP